MSRQPCLATIRGLPHVPGITEINVRSGPGTNFDISFKGPVGMSGLEILAVLPDAEGKDKDGKIYQWFKVVFHGGAIGWVRDDLLEIAGDCSNWGYPSLSESTFVFALNRQSTQDSAASPTITLEVTSSTAEPSVSSPREADTSLPSTSQPDDLVRIKKASFKITAAFEGAGYDAYNNYDAGIVSYGLIQFTLASGSLLAVLDQYLAASTSPISSDLRAYYSRVQSRDQSLRQDERFKQLLKQAANETEMQKAQDEVATQKYWNAVVDGYVTPRGLQTPLAYALLFDMGVNFGTGHAFVRKAEHELGVPPRSKPGENGITEMQLITRVAELRKASHYRQADRDNLPGLKVRGDFWINLIQSDDWGLQGDSNGNVIVNRRQIQVRNP